MSDKFVSPCPPPSAKEAELLHVLIEECAEVQQRATKMLRFGVKEVQSGQRSDNMTRLSFEVGDLLEIIDRVQEAGLLDQIAGTVGRECKQKQLEKYLQH